MTPPPPAVDRVRPVEGGGEPGSASSRGVSWRREGVDVDGQRLAFATAGRGRDVVLLHGLMTSHEEMILALGEALADGYRVTAFDRPGHGRSTRPSGGASLAAQARLLLRGFDALGLDRPVLVGHSAGGALALTIAVRHPRSVRGVVALAPLVFPEPRLEMVLFGPRGIPLLGPLAARTVLRPSDLVTLPLLWHAIFVPQRMPDGFLQALPLAELATADEVIATGEDTLSIPFDLTANLPRYALCDVPVRILAGSADAIVNNRLQGALLPSLMPDCTFEAVSGGGHMIHHGHPGRVTRLVDDLMEKRVAAAC